MWMIGTTVAPSIHVAWYASAPSSQFGTQIATTSPGPIPNFEIPLASLKLRWYISSSRIDGVWDDGLGPPTKCIVACGNVSAPSRM